MKEVCIKAKKPLTICLQGEIDSGNSDEFFEEVMNAYTSAPGDITFECGELDFIDSTTLGTFVKILKRVKTEGHSLTLCGLQPRLKKLFVICALDTVMGIAS